jgi:hypothetical protein
MFNRLLIALVLVASLSSFPAAAKDKTQIDQAKVAGMQIALANQNDKFKGRNGWFPAKIKAIGGTHFLTDVYLNPVYVEDGDGTKGYYLWIRYNGYGWVFLNGQVIFVLGDGSKIELTGPDSSDHRDIDTCIGGAGCIDSEEIRVPITAAQLKALSTATSAEVRIYGRSIYLEGYLKDVHAAEVRAVLAFGEPRRNSTASTPSSQ